VQHIELSHISKSYGETSVIDNLSLDIGAHEFIVFLGPSGCGKSTLLRMIAGLESVDAGEIHVAGRRIDRLPPGQRGVAMVFQHYALYPHMSVRENMAFGLRNVGIDAADIVRRIDEAARMLEITHLLERKPAQVSGGQRQRVAIGRAIVKAPQLFLFDEPLSNLDAALRARTRIELAQLHQRVNAATLFVTHDQVEAMTLAHRIVVLNGGCIEQIGTPREIYARPASRFVAGFVGTPTMNFAEAMLLPPVNGRACVRLGNGATLVTAIAAQQLDATATCTLGVRPQSIAVADPGSAPLRGPVRIVEHLGDRTLLHVELGAGLSLVAEDSGASRVAVGELVGLQIASSGMHLFAGKRGYHAESPADAPPGLRA